MKIELRTYPLGATEGITSNFGNVDASIYNDIRAQWSNGRLILTIGERDYTFTPEQLEQLRQTLTEVADVVERLAR